MPFTQAQVLASARDRTGNVVTTSAGEEFAPDHAIVAEMRGELEQVLEVFGGASTRKRTQFHAAPEPLLATPAAPSPTPSTTGGTLPAGTYSYRVTATIPGGETVPGPAASATTTGATGSVALTWPAVANATGYRVYGRTAGAEQLLAAVAVAAWTDDGSARVRGGQPQRNTTGRGFLQDYPLDPYVGDDVLRVIEVLRGDMVIEEGSLGGSDFDEVHPHTGLRTGGRGLIDQGLQREVLDVIEAQARYRHLERFSAPTVVVDGVACLRLVPRPTSAVYVDVTYLSTADSISALPDRARNAVELSACRAILECMLNRAKNDPVAMKFGDVDEAREWFKHVRAQRDRYEARFRAALARR